MIDLQPVIDSLKAELAKVDAGIEAMEQLQRFRQKYSLVDPPAAGATITPSEACELAGTVSRESPEEKSWGKEQNRFMEHTGKDGLTKQALSAFEILQAAKMRCTNWDGVIILDAAMYRLAGISWGPSVLAQMPEAWPPTEVK